jgi:Ca2+-dependent lipid-binding protein
MIIPFKSLNSDILRLEIIDWDKFGKHDKLCMKDFPLTNYQPGKIYTDTYSLIPLEGRNLEQLSL